MTDKKLTLGQAIDRMIEALEPLESQARQTAINAACSHLGIQVGEIESTPKSGTVLSTENPVINPVGTVIKQMDIRTLKEQKNPKSAKQMACLVAYYLQELAPQSEQKNTVTAADLTKYFKQAGFKLPKIISQLLPDSRAAGYFDSAPGKGEYALNAVGYNLVAHSLSQTATK